MIHAAKILFQWSLGKYKLCSNVCICAFCVGLDLGWVGKRVKEKLSDQCGVRALYAYSLILDDILW